jgi:hypothetical protein
MVSEALKDWEQTGDAFTSPVLQLAKDAGALRSFWRVCRTCRRRWSLPRSSSSWRC